jgi:hypothetical protein
MCVLPPREGRLEGGYWHDELIDEQAGQELAAQGPSVAGK